MFQGDGNSYLRKTTKLLESEINSVPMPQRILIVDDDETANITQQSPIMWPLRNYREH